MISRGLIAAVRAYQALLSPFLGGACKFYPSCSEYAVEAIERHGPKHGARLVAGRLLRCRPFSAGGLDPVPDVSVPVKEESRS
jgi:putative membrane protein insertion efficiency factor